MTKKRLRAYREMEMERQQIKAQLRKLDDRDAETWAALTSATAAPSDGMPHGQASTPDEKRVRLLSLLDENAAEREVLRARYAAKLREIDREQLAVELAIDSLDARQRTLLRHYYIDCMTWEEVALAMHYCLAHVHRIHGDALQVLREKE